VLFLLSLLSGCRPRSPRFRGCQKHEACPDLAGDQGRG